MSIMLNSDKRQYVAGCVLMLTSAFTRVDAQEVTFSEVPQPSLDNKSMVAEQVKQLTPKVSETPKISYNSIVDAQFDHGLKPEYSSRNIQRALTMAGYEIGIIDGDIGSKTRTAISKMVAQYSEHFYGVEENNFSEIYNVMRQVGPKNLLESRERIQLSIRAIEAGARTSSDPRIMVRGEVVLTNPQNDKSFYIIESDSGHYSGQWLNENEISGIEQQGNEVFFPQFNSGGLNFKGNNRSYQKASGLWNPFNGSALPGLSGGTVYGLDWKWALFNKDFDKPGFGDKNGENQSWIHFTERDPQVLNGRSRFGFHVDGITVGKSVNDGTAGCPAIHEEYAPVFFKMLDVLSGHENIRPNHVSVMAPKQEQPVRSASLSYNYSL